MRRRHPVVEVGAYGAIPAELLDADAAVWHDFALYSEWVESRGWSVSSLARIGGSKLSPEYLRTSAAEQWAVENGITDAPDSADWHKLRALKMID